MEKKNNQVMKGKDGGFHYVAKIRFKLQRLFVQSAMETTSYFSTKVERRRMVISPSIKILQRDTLTAEIYGKTYVFVYVFCI